MYMDGWRHMWVGLKGAIMVGFHVTKNYYYYYYYIHFGSLLTNDINLGNVWTLGTSQNFANSNEII